MDCVISTPLRLISTISSGKIDFAKVEVLVMDEGDKLFEDGFIEQVELSRTVERRSTQFWVRARTLTCSDCCSAPRYLL